MGHSMNDILEAAKRVADKRFFLTVEAARKQLISSVNAGRIGSSSHMAAELRIFVNGYEQLCEAAADRVANLATEGVDAYFEPLGNLLREYWPSIEAGFIEHCAVGKVQQGAPRQEADRLVLRLKSELEQLAASALADFRLNFPADGSPLKVPHTVGPSSQGDHSPIRVGYPATVLKVMIASPSDVAAERNIIRDVIHEWNAVHSEDRSLVLMPVGWESHSSPAMGDRAQEIINRQILRGCDLLVGVFWTRFGTPTGKADSGTAEEIFEHLEAGKPALIYFSSEPVHPDSIDPAQYKALKAFETEIQKRGLVERYETKALFRERLSRQLAQTIIREFERGTENSVASLGQPLPVAPVTEFQETLTDEARQLLLEAAKDSGGVVTRIQFLGGTKVETNGRQFVGSNEPRTVAKWTSAIDELERYGFIEDKAGNGEVFFVTSDGYNRADRLAQGL